MIFLMIFESTLLCFVLTGILWHYGRKSFRTETKNITISFIFFTLSIILAAIKRADELIFLHWYLYDIIAVMFSVFMGISAFFFTYSVFDTKECDNIIKKNVVSSLIMICFGLISAFFIGYWSNTALFIWIVAMAVFLLHSMHKKISVDNLTSLCNRYGMDEEIREQLQQYAKDKNDSFYLIVCDLDNFKHINDTWGHLEGDRALILISCALLEVSKEFDAEVFRIGGDEFVIITDKSDEGLADRITERIKEQLDKIDFRDDFQIKISMGVSLYDGKIHIKDLLENADKKMYEAKKLAKDL